MKENAAVRWNDIVKFVHTYVYCLKLHHFEIALRIQTVCEKRQHSQQVPN